MGDNLRISNRVKQTGTSAIHEMTRLSKEIDDVAFLSWAKPTSDTPEHIKQAAVQAIGDGLVGGYSAPLGLPALREEIAKKLIRDNTVDAKASQVLVTVGAIEGLAAAVMTIIDPGDEVIVPSPTYATPHSPGASRVGETSSRPQRRSKRIRTRHRRNRAGHNKQNQGDRVRHASQSHRHRIQ